MNTLQSTHWLHFSTAPEIVRRALITMLVVGTLLNTINQYDALFGAASIQWVQLVLTFAVPYIVATVSGAMAMSANATAIDQARNNDHNNKTSTTQATAEIHQFKPRSRAKIICFEHTAKAEFVDREFQQFHTTMAKPSQESR